MPEMIYVVNNDGRRLVSIWKTPTDHYDLGVFDTKNKTKFRHSLFRQYCDDCIMQEALVFPRLLSRTTISIHREFKKNWVGVIINLMLVITGLGCEDVSDENSYVAEGLDCQLTTSQKKE